MKNANGINPIIAILLTLCVCALCVVFFITRHTVWGTIFALITLDFAADAVLSLTPRK